MRWVGGGGGGGAGLKVSCGEVHIPAGTLSAGGRGKSGDREGSPDLYKIRAVGSRHAILNQVHLGAGQASKQAHV